MKNRYLKMYLAVAKCDGINETTDRYTTVPNHPGDMPEGTLRAIPREAGIAPDGFSHPKLSPRPSL